MKQLSPLFLLLLLVVVSACQAPTSATEGSVSPTLTPTITPASNGHMELRTNICCHGTIVQPGRYRLPAWLHIPFGVAVEQEGWIHYNEEAGELFGFVKGNSNSLGIPSETIYFFPAYEPQRASQFFQAFINAVEFDMVAEPSDTTIAGYPARQVDLIAKPSTLEENAPEDTPYGVQPLTAVLRFSPTGLYWTTWSEEAYVRVLKVDIDDYSVIIYLESPQVDFERFAAEALAILNTLTPIE